MKADSPQQEPSYNHILKQEKEAFLQMYPQLKELYYGQYVAILGEAVIDYDSNYNELYERLRTLYPTEIIWVSQIYDTPLPDIVVRSPRFVTM
jgi:hypothetical protein